MQYYDQWVKVLREVQKVEPSEHGSWNEEAIRLRNFCKIYRNLADGPKSLRNLDDAFNTEHPDALQWKKKAGEVVAKVKSFSEVSRGQ